jgi:hypothetical protein
MFTSWWSCSKVGGVIIRWWSCSIAEFKSWRIVPELAELFTCWWSSSRADGAVPELMELFQN